jgi:hypothetical protein
MLTDALYAFKHNPEKAAAMKDKIKSIAATPEGKAKLEAAAAKLADALQTPEGQEVIAIIRQNVGFFCPCP